MTAGLYAACEFAVHLVKADGTILRAGRAVLFILANVGYRPLARLLSLPPFVWGVEVLYRLVARNRPFFAHFLFTKER